MRFVRDLRLIPVVALAAAALFLLKMSAIVVEGGYTLISSRVALAQGLGAGVKRERFRRAATRRARRHGAAQARQSRSLVGARYLWAARIYRLRWGEVGCAGACRAREGGSAGGEHHGASRAKGILFGRRAGRARKPAQRRQELETRAREIDVRDSLLKAAEKRIEQRLQELKELEARVNGTITKKDEEEAAKFKSLVGMYENMKAKDAAKVFDRLNMRVLVEVVNVMNPRRMADILGQMTPDVAERLTVGNCQPLRCGRQSADDRPRRSPQDRGPAEGLRRSPRADG